MTTQWYCKECDEQIESEEIAAHEEDGHQVKGYLRPERLLPSDPWAIGSSSNGGQTD